MRNFIFSINETLQKDIGIEAETRDEAEKELLELYKNKGIVMEIEHIEELEDFDEVYERRLQDFEITIGQKHKRIFIDFDGDKSKIGFYTRDPYNDNIYYKYIDEKQFTSKVEFLKDIEKEFNIRWNLSTFKNEKDHGWNVEGKKIGEFQTLVEYVCKSMNENDLNIAEKEGYFIDEKRMLSNVDDKVLFKLGDPDNYDIGFFVVKDDGMYYKYIEERDYKKKKNPLRELIKDFNKEWDLSTFEKKEIAFYKDRDEVISDFVNHDYFIQCKSFYDIADKIIIDDLDISQGDKNIFIDFDGNKSEIGFYMRHPYDDSIYYEYINKGQYTSKVEFLKDVERSFNGQWNLSTFKNEKDHGWNVEGKKLGKFQNLVDFVCSSMNENELNIAEKEGYFIDEKNKLKSDHNKILYKSYDPETDFISEYDYKVVLLSVDDNGFYTKEIDSIEYNKKENPLREVIKDFNKEWDLSTFEYNEIGSYEEVCDFKHEFFENNMYAEKCESFYDIVDSRRNQCKIGMSEYDLLMEKRMEEREILEILGKLENSDNTNEQKEQEKSEKKVNENNIQTNKNKVKRREKERQM